MKRIGCLVFIMSMSSFAFAESPCDERIEAAISVNADLGRGLVNHELALKIMDEENFNPNCSIHTWTNRDPVFFILVNSSSLKKAIELTDAMLKKGWNPKSGKTFVDGVFVGYSQESTIALLKYFEKNGLNLTTAIGVYDSGYGDANLVMTAAINGKEKVLEFLVKERGMGLRTKMGTALHRAAAYNRLAATRTLVQLGAKVSDLDIYGKTALDYATSYGSAELIQFLTEQTQIK